MGTDWQLYATDADFLCGPRCSARYSHREQHCTCEEGIMDLSNKQKEQITTNFSS
jgi:hypothetical protein